METTLSDHTPATRLLVVEDDPDLLDLLGSILEEEGYTVTLVASLDAACEHIAACTFDGILTDLLTHDRGQMLSSALAILRAASPTPVAILTAWQLDAETVQREGFTALIQKPFDIDLLLVSIAAATHLARTPQHEQQRERQRATVFQYVAALNAQDWDALVSLSTETMVCALPGKTPWYRHFQGPSREKVRVERVRTSGWSE
jgi:DNA-binding NtrC family response regulator